MAMNRNFKTTGMTYGEVIDLINANAGAQAGSVPIIVSDAGTIELLASADGVSRAIIIVSSVDVARSSGDGTPPAIAIGETDDAEKFCSSLYPLFPLGSAGDTFVLAGTLTAGKSCIATAVAGTGTATGGVTITVIAFPIN